MHYIFYTYLKEMGIPEPVREYKFHPERRWRFDFAWPGLKIALEVEGGVYTGGRHTRGHGFIGDMEKYNAAGTMGWIVLRCTPSNLNKLETIKLIQTTIQNKNL